MDLNDGKPYHVPGFQTGVPPLWPQAKEGDTISVHNTLGTTFYKFSGGEWYKVSFLPRPEMPIP